MTPLTPDEIWTIYQNLPNKQQVLVQLVAVAYDPLRYSEARALYVEFFERRGEKVSPRVKALNELAGFHVLEGDGSWVAVAEEIAEDVCYHAVRCGHLADLLAVTEPHFQASKYALRDFPAVRRRLLTDGSTVLVNLPASAQEESLEALSSRISQIDTLELVPVGLHAVLIFHKLERSFTVHSHIDRFLNYLGAATAKGEPLHEEIQFHQFLRGSRPAEPSPKVRSAMGFFEGEKAPDKPFSPPFEGASSLWDFLSYAVQRPTQEELSLCRDVVLQKCVPSGPPTSLQGAKVFWRAGSRKSELSVLFTSVSPICGAAWSRRFP